MYNLFIQKRIVGLEAASRQKTLNSGSLCLLNTEVLEQYAQLGLLPKEPNTLPFRLAVPLVIALARIFVLPGPVARALAPI